MGKTIICNDKEIIFNSTLSGTRQEDDIIIPTDKSGMIIKCIEELITKIENRLVDDSFSD